MNQRPKTITCTRNQRNVQKNHNSFFKRQILSMFLLATTVGVLTTIHDNRFDIYITANDDDYNAHQVVLENRYRQGNIITNQESIPDTTNVHSVPLSLFQHLKFDGIIASSDQDEEFQHTPFQKRSSRRKYRREKQLQQQQDKKTSQDASTLDYIEEILPVTYPKWPLDKLPLPCFQETSRLWWKLGKKPIDHGFLFVKTHKTGSSTAAGIHLRMVRNIASKQNWQPQLKPTNSSSLIVDDQQEQEQQRREIQSLPLEDEQYNEEGIASEKLSLHDDAPKHFDENSSIEIKKLNTNTSQSSLTGNLRTQICKARWEHSAANKMGYGNRNRVQSFLWSILRNPTKRAISHFFHFQVSRRNVEPTDENFKHYLMNDNQLRSYYIKTLSTTKTKEWIDYDSRNQPSIVMIQNIKKIFQDYNFIGITERMDETAVVLQMLLGLSTADVLYISVKGKGSFDAGGFNNTCTYIEPAFVSPGMESFFKSDYWQNLIRWDQKLYEAANENLDRTIESLGSSEFKRNLWQLRQAQKVVRMKCYDDILLPCSKRNMKPLRRNETDCLWKDSSCGTSCLDMVSTELELW